MTLIWRPGYITTFADPDVQSYLTRVEEADNQRLEYPVAVAIDEFIRGCKADGIWPAIKASCIMAGARTLAGALVPLVGPAPTNFNFVAGDYNRKTGLVGNGSTKYLNSNRNNNADPQDSKHIAAFQSVHQSRTGTRSIVGAGSTGTGASSLLTTTTQRIYRANTSTNVAIADISTSAGLWGVSRFSSSLVDLLFAGTLTANQSSTSSTPATGSLLVFARNSATPGAPEQFSDARLAFYSIGESLDLALLDARITTLINRFAVVIP